MKKLLLILLCLPLIGFGQNLIIGDTYQGGVIFFFDSLGGGLISTTSDQSTGSEWGCFGTSVGASGTAIGTGNQNTIDIETGCPTVGIASDICANLTFGGYSDWFLPSINELIEMRLNIGQGNALGLGNIGGFSNGNYWSSSEDGSYNAWFQEGGVVGNYFLGSKNNTLYVRAIRAFSPIILGCTDPLACNYDSLATIDDSSCIYLNIIAIATNVSCNGGIDGGIVATATGGTFPLQYSLGAGLSQASGTFPNLSVGTYYIDVTDMNGCTSNQMVIITEPIALSILVASADETSAFNDGSATAIINGGTPPYAYTWSNGGTANPQVNLVPGLYTVDVIDANGCVISDSTYVNAYSPTGIIDIKNISKTPIKVTNMLGQETTYRRSTPLFYIYDDGTVEKRIVIE